MSSVFVAALSKRKRTACLKSKIFLVIYDLISAAV